jgi:hypothetical protein
LPLGSAIAARAVVGAVSDRIIVHAVVTAATIARPIRNIALR